MKKLSNKQKLICFIAILLVVVIIAIIVTTSIMRNNNQVTSEGYFATTANAGSSLVASYIKKGITVGGITGTLETLDTSDATAYAEDIAYGKIAYARGERIVGTRIDSDTLLDSDEIYYADIDDNGTVDGVIFADLAVGGSGQWNDDFYSVYEILKESNLKSYYIKYDNYTDDFGNGKVIAPMKETSGNERFYVMALDDIDSNTYYWYYNALGKLDNTIVYNKNDFGKGRENTKYVNDKWNDLSLPWGAHNDNDMWGSIQDEIEEGWFVPSKSEWAAFGAKFDIISSNYPSFGLNYKYWASSISSTMYAYNVIFNYGRINGEISNSAAYVRLATTF